MEQKSKPIVSADISVAGIGNGHTPSSRRMGGRYLEILFSFFVMTVPMLAFSALLLGLIYHYRIVRNPFPSDNLRFDGGQDGSTAIYVGISATTLITVASWSSTIAPLLIGIALTLLSYPIASTLLKAEQDSRPEQLPTTFQLSLMLRMLCSGGPGSFWHWITYALGWRGRRQSQPPVLKRMTIMLCVGTLLSTLVFITDTWLHFTTKTTIFTQVAPNTIPTNHSFTLRPECTNITAPYSGLSGCTLNPAAAVTFILHGSTTIKVLNNVSETTMVRTVSRDGAEFAYLGNTPQSQLSAIDYTANTWAVESKCTPVTTQCMDESQFFGAGTPFKCPFAFEGDLKRVLPGPWQMAYFTDSSATDNSTQAPIPNPYYFSVAAALNEKFGRIVNGPNENDPEFLTATHGAMVFALFCNATVYDLEYSMVNGSITRFLYQPSNSSSATIVQGTQKFTNLGDSVLQQAASVAAYDNSAQGLADGIAVAYSRVALSVAAGAFTPQPAAEAQLRREILVARVPKAPLAFLLLANLLLVVLGITLTVFALSALRGDTAEIQALLSITGLVTSSFEQARALEGTESVEALFEENSGRPGPRIGISRTSEGGWAYTTWRPQETVVRGD